MGLATIVWLCAIGLGFVLSARRSILWKPARITTKTFVVATLYNLFLLGVLFTVPFSFSAAALGLVAILNIVIFGAKIGTMAEPVDGPGEWVFFILFNLACVACALTL